MKHSKEKSLWVQFVSIAQPYFFPRIPDGGKRTLLLIFILLLVAVGIGYSFFGTLAYSYLPKGG